MCCHVFGPLLFGFVFRQFEEGKGEIQSVFKPLRLLMRRVARHKARSTFGDDSSHPLA